MVTNGMPLVSVVTPSFNQAAFIKETIESVLGQNYPNVEHIVVDGGSTDGTLDILQHYARTDSRFRFVSEPDRGQSDAINKGVNMANGTIIGWLNSDDTYLAGAIAKAVDAFIRHPDWGVVYGKAYMTNEASQILHEYNVEPYTPDGLFRFCNICQPAAFIRKSVFLDTGGVDVGLRFCMDYDLWIRISKRYPIGFIAEHLATSRYHPTSKTATQWANIGMAEVNHTVLKHYGAISDLWSDQSFLVYGEQTPWILVNGAKEHGAFGETPTVQFMNRFHDNWVPRRFKMVVRHSMDNPMHRLIVKGNHVMPAMVSKKRGPMGITVYVDGKRVRRYVVRPGAFELTIPLSSGKPEAVVELVASKRFRPSKWKISRDKRLLSCMVYEAVACSAKEFGYYEAVRENPKTAGSWMLSNK